MKSYPVDVSRTDDGDYEARLADLSTSPVGRGIDPYAALEDLDAPARTLLRKLHSEDALPEPATADDRPTLDFDPNADNSDFSGQGLVNEQTSDDSLIGYTWTNSTVFTSR